MLIYATGLAYQERRLSAIHLLCDLHDPDMSVRIVSEMFGPFIKEYDLRLTLMPFFAKI